MLPVDDSIELLIAQRRVRGTPSLPSSPASSPPVTTKYRGRRKRGKLDMAGLVGGDSDSSALTQESGDEGALGTPGGSVVTGTDGGTDYAEVEDVEMRGPSAGKGKFRHFVVVLTFLLAPSTSPKPTTRHRSKPGKKRGRPPAGSSITRAAKKRKR